MKQFLILTTVLVCILAGCTLGPKTITLSGTIKFEGHDPAGTIYVGLYPEVYNYGREVGEPIELLELDNPEFTLQVKPGRYGLAVWAFPFEKYQTNILILKSGENIHFDITLPHYGLRPEYDGYCVVGAINNWSGPGKPMVKQGDKWILPDTSLMPLNGVYKFFSGNEGFLDLAKTDLELVKDWASLNNIYKGGPVILDPSLYEAEPREATAEIQGGETTIRFNALREALDKLSNEQVMPVLRQMNTLSDKEKIATWTRLNKTLDSLETANPDLSQMVIEQRFGYIRHLHPRQVKRSALLKAKADESEMNAFYQSETNRDYYQYYLNLADKLDPKSLLLEGGFAQVFVGFQSDLDKIPQTAELLNVPSDYFDKKLMDLIQNSSERVVTGVCMTAGSQYAYMGKADAAREFLTKLKSDYPDHRYVKDGNVDRYLKSLAINEGNNAPDFSITTLTGNSFKLSDQKGKFVMIDFWGSWCGPCRGEVPNFKNLYTTIPRDSLILIGLANDDSTDLVQFIAEQKIPYPNALATEDILKAYGINAYPTTLLIGPDGKIAGKNLRGESVIDQVREKMKMYKESA